MPLRSARLCMKLDGATSMRIHKHGRGAAPASSAWAGETDVAGTARLIVYRQLCSTGAQRFLAPIALPANA